MVPGKGLFDGPRIWNVLTMMLDMLAGPPSGPSVPKPMLTFMKAVECPLNQPGCQAMAPPVVGQ